MKDAFRLECLVTFPLFAIALHPRKGTETVLPAACRLSHPIALHPRKGTETNKLYAPKQHNEIALHPRKGTETATLLPFVKYFASHYIPVRGRKPV